MDKSMRRAWAKLLCLALALGLPGAWSETVCSAAAGGGAPTEQEVKAAYLFHFTKYIDWPESAFTNKEAPCVVGGLGKDPFGNLLDAALRDKTVKGRRFVILRNDDPAALKDCHLVFIDSDSTARLARDLSAFKDRPVVTVGQRDGFTRSGGVINLYVAEGTVRIKINIAACERSSLKVSNQLLRLDKVIITRDGKEVTKP